MGLADMPPVLCWRGCCPRRKKQACRAQALRVWHPVWGTGMPAVLLQDVDPENRGGIAPQMAQLAIKVYNVTYGRDSSRPCESRPIEEQ